MITCPWLSRLEEWSWKFDSLQLRRVAQVVLVAQEETRREDIVGLVGLILSDLLSKSSREITVLNKQQSLNNPVLSLLWCLALLHRLHPFVLS